LSAVAFSLKGAGWFGDGYGTKAEPTTSEGQKSAGTGATTDVAAPGAAPTETTAVPTTQDSTSTQTETKSTVVVTPAPTIKTEIKSQGG